MLSRTLTGPALTQRLKQSIRYSRQFFEEQNIDYAAIEKR